MKKSILILSIASVFVYSCESDVDHQASLVDISNEISIDLSSDESLTNVEKMNRWLVNADHPVVSRFIEDVHQPEGVQGFNGLGTMYKYQLIDAAGNEYSTNHIPHMLSDTL